MCARVSGHDCEVAPFAEAWIDTRALGSVSSSVVWVCNERVVHDDAAFEERGHTMQQRRMGRTGLKVSNICLGTMTFAGQADEATSRKISTRRTSKA